MVPNPELSICFNTIPVFRRSPCLQDAEEYARSSSMPFLETSAKNADNVEAAFLTMASSIKSRVAKAPAPSAGGTGAKVTMSGADISGTKSSGGCC